MALADPTTNYLGLEIRHPVVDFALTRVAKRNMTNCHFVCCNANVDLANVMEAVAAAGSRVKTASVLFPDPHFKNHHKKRRVVTDKLVEDLLAGMRGGGDNPNSGVGDETVYIASDVQSVLDDMRATVGSNEGFADEGGEGGRDGRDLPYLEENPCGIPTEREVSVVVQGKGVWRALFRPRAKGPGEGEKEEEGKGRKEGGGEAEARSGGKTTSEEDRAGVEELEEKIREANERAGSAGSAAGAPAGGAQALPPSVKIESGANKYVLVTATSPTGGSLFLVHSSAAAEYHKDVASPLVASLLAAGCGAVKVRGGGRIERNDERRTIDVYGFSYGFGKGDHKAVAANLRRREEFEGWEVEWRDGGY